jgi:hypothetical protein
MEGLALVETSTFAVTVDVVMGIPMGWDTPGARQGRRPRAGF